MERAEREKHLRSELEDVVKGIIVSTYVSLNIQEDMSTFEKIEQAKKDMAEGSKILNAIGSLYINLGMEREEVTNLIYNTITSIRPTEYQ